MKRSADEYPTPNVMYSALLLRLVNTPEYIVRPRGQLVYELTNVLTEVRAPYSDPIKTMHAERDAVIERYTQDEIALYDSGTRSAEDFARISKFWLKLANPDGTINSNYGWLLNQKADYGNVQFSPEMSTAWDWARKSLVNDPDTRQAVMLFSRPEFFWPGNKDQVCTLSGCFQIRGGELNFSTNMRSQDIWYGLSYDAAYFCLLLHRMLKELHAAGLSSVRLGTWTHYTHSLHLYDRNLVDAMRVLGYKSPEAAAEAKRNLLLKRHGQPA